MPDHGPPRWEYFLNPWWHERHLYFTDLSIEECRQRLTESTTRFLGRQVGRSLFSLSDFSLYRVTFYSNGFKPFAHVAMTQGPAGGTLVRVSTSAALFTQVFFGFWFGFLVHWILVAIVGVLTRPGSVWWAPLFGLGMAIFGAALNTGGRLLAASDPEFLTTFVQDELTLREPPAWATPVA